MPQATAKILVFPVSQIKRPLLKFYLWFRFSHIVSSSACHSASIYQIPSKLDRPRQSYLDVIIDVSIWRPRHRNSTSDFVLGHWPKTKSEVELRCRGRHVVHLGRSKSSAGADPGICVKGPAPSFLPLLSFPFPFFPFLLLLTLPSPPLPFPLEVGPLTPARRSAERSKLPQRGPRRSPGRKRI